jgi:hypothetical protein
LKGVCCSEFGSKPGTVLHSHRRRALIRWPRG